jgi:hypothetical protein
MGKVITLSAASSQEKQNLSSIIYKLKDINVGMLGNSQI